jgi:hypothetical protein
MSNLIVFLLRSAQCYTYESKNDTFNYGFRVYDLMWLMNGGNGDSVKSTILLMKKLSSMYYYVINRSMNAYYF